MQLLPLLLLLILVGTQASEFEDAMSDFSRDSGLPILRTEKPKMMVVSSKAVGIMAGQEVLHGEFYVDIPNNMIYVAAFLEDPQWTEWKARFYHRFWRKELDTVWHNGYSKFSNDWLEPFMEDWEILKTNSWWGKWWMKQTREFVRGWFFRKGG